MKKTQNAKYSCVNMWVEVAFVCSGLAEIDYVGTAEKTYENLNKTTAACSIETVLGTCTRFSEWSCN